MSGTKGKILTPEAALNEVERRIRHQASAAEVGSMVWRAHMADIIHVTEVRKEVEAQNAD